MLKTDSTLDIKDALRSCCKEKYFMYSSKVRILIYIKYLYKISRVDTEEGLMRSSQWEISNT